MSEHEPDLYEREGDAAAEVMHAAKGLETMWKVRDDIELELERARKRPRSMNEIDVLLDGFSEAETHASDAYERLFECALAFVTARTAIVAARLKDGATDGG